MKERGSKSFLELINRHPRVLSGREVQMCLEGANALWLYRDGGCPLREFPHALLASGKHSGGYVNVGSAMREHSGLRQAFAQTLVSALDGVYSGVVDFVVGADTSSTDLAREVAVLVGADHIRMVKIDDAAGKRQACHPDNPVLTEGSIILQVEELITTSFSALQVREGIRQKHPGLKIKFVPFLLTVVERSDPDNRILTVGESLITPSLRLNIGNYEPVDCPYCRVGSQAIKPKEGDNWSLLTKESE